MDEHTKAIMFASTTGNHGTPQDFFDQLHNEFYFDRDVAAHYLNAKCPDHYGEQEDGLFINGLEEAWGEPGDTVYCNPPYGREITSWLDKALKEKAIGVSSVFLLPARTDTKWFHEMVIPNAAEIRFIKGRLKFEGMDAGAPFPSIVVIFFGDLIVEEDNEPKEPKYSWANLATGN